MRVYSRSICGKGAASAGYTHMCSNSCSNMYISLCVCSRGQFLERLRPPRGIHICVVICVVICIISLCVCITGQFVERLRPPRPLRGLGLFLNGKDAQLDLKSSIHVIYEVTLTHAPTRTHTHTHAHTRTHNEFLPQRKRCWIGP